MTINPVEITKNQLQLDVIMDAAEIQDLLKKELKKHQAHQTSLQL